MFAFAFLIYVAAMGRGVVSGILQTPTLVLLGEMSFSMYLLHQIFIRLYENFNQQLPELTNVQWNAAYWSTTLAASYITLNVIERPCRRALLRFGASLK